MPGEPYIVWSCVGSAGAVNPPDIGKLVTQGSVVQLGLGATITRSPQVGRGAGPETQAVIRYTVIPRVDSLSNPMPRMGLDVQWRMGDGQITARLVQVKMSLPQASPEETTLIEFQAAPVDGGKRTVFHAQTTYIPRAYFDFQKYVYYVELTLTAPADVVIESPPAVSAMQLLFT
jgi:hypothetical protein